MGYYGTVEQQGHFTLHLHLLVWIQGTLSPDETQKALMDPASTFQQKLVQYLESVFVGEFMTGSKDVIFTQLDQNRKDSNYSDSSESLPPIPPAYCKKKCETCSTCLIVNSWWPEFKTRVEQILALSNIHKCTSTHKKDGSQDRHHHYIGCLDNKWGKCKSHCPRPTFPQTIIDIVNGIINIKN